MSEAEKKPYKQKADDLNNGRKPQRIDIQPAPSNFVQRAVKVEVTDLDLREEREDLEDIGRNLIFQTISEIKCNQLPLTM